MYYVYYIKDRYSNLQEFATYEQADDFCENFKETTENWLEFIFQSDTGVEPLSKTFMENVFIPYKAPKKPKSLKLFGNKKD